VQTQLQIVSILVSLGLFLLIFELVRRRRLLERYALLWLFTAVVLLGLSVWGDLLDQVSRAIGVGYGPSTLFAVALGFITVLLLHFSVVISRLAEQNKVLAQHVGLLQRRLERLEAAAGDARDPAATGTTHAAPDEHPTASPEARR
jgi:hypothetical protein